MDLIKEKNTVSTLFGFKRDQLVNVVDKNWGREEWIVNNPKYCGKRMIVKKGYRCSMHYHKIKEESFYIVSGKIFLEMNFNGVTSERIVTQGDVIHIRQYEAHRFTGLEDSIMMEFSTHHMEADSYRSELSGKVDLEKLNF